MAVKLLFRATSGPNHFREWAIAALNCKSVDKVLLCSGFFQQLRGTKKISYRLASDKDFINALTSNPKRLVKTVGVHNHSWLADYRAFANALRKLSPPSFTLNAYRSKRLKWHAKILILFVKGRPVFAIIGSSNMTRPAFAPPHITPDFNHESDVVLWDDKYKPILNSIMDLERSSQEGPFEINLRYSPQDNKGDSISDRLKKIYDSVNPEDDENYEKI